MWQVLGPILASMAGGAASSAISNATSKPGYQGYDMPMMTPSPYDATNQALMAQIAQQSALNAQQGRLDPGMEALLSQIAQRLIAEERKKTFGVPGMRGGSLMDAAMSAGTQSGVGGKALNTAIMPRALNDYANRYSQILNYIDSIKVNQLQNQRQQSFNQMANMPRSSEIPWSGQIVSMNQPTQPGIDIGLGGIDYVDLFKNAFKSPTSYSGTSTTKIQPQYRLSGALGSNNTLADKLAGQYDFS